MLLVITVYVIFKNAALYMNVSAGNSAKGLIVDLNIDVAIF